MFRFFSAAVLLNWVAAMAVVALSGFGLTEEGGGLVKAFASLLSSQTLFSVEMRIAELTSMGFALAGLTAGLWAILALIVADNSKAQQADQNFVVAASLGFCLLLLMSMLMLAAWAGDAALGALACIASLLTVAAGVAYRSFAMGEEGAEEPLPMQTLSENKSHSMALQSASLAMTGHRLNRFVPKQPYRP